MQNTDNLCFGCMNDNGGEKVCSICGYDSSKQNPASFLKTGTVLQERFIVGKTLENNGEGVTYIGWDISNDSVVNIREYFPAFKATRKKDGSVGIAEGNGYAFNEGILEFLELNRKLANIEELPSLLPVTAVFEHGGTAYAVSKAPAASITLREFLMRNGGTLTWDQVRPLFLPLLTTVGKLNDAGIIHGGISPETILVCRDGKLRISGICVRPVRVANSSLEAQLFPGFAASEQYGISAAGDIGKYTDVYAVAATLFRVIMGTNPPEATHRIEADNMAVPSKIAQTLPKNVLTALANALQVYPVDRTANMDLLKNELMLSSDTAPIVIKNAAPEAKTGTTSAAKNKGKKMDPGKKYAIISAAVTAGVFILIALVLVLTVFRENIFGGDKDATSTYASAPQVDQVGDNDTSYTSVEKTYVVPDLKNVSLAEILDNEDYDVFDFIVTKKEYSSKVAKGGIIEQSLAAGESVKKGTEISIVVSLGPQEVTVPSVRGKTEEEAIILLLQTGFLYENIEIMEKYDPDAPALLAIDTDPEVGTKANIDGKIRVYMNTYTGDEVTSGEVYTSSAIE